MSVFHALGTTSPRWWRRFAAIVGMSLALVVATGAPAHAAIGVLSDDLEAADAGTVWESSTGGCCFESTDAHSPSHYGFIPPTMYENSFVSLGRSVHLPAVLSSNTRCRASIWVKPTYSPILNVEVINPTDWTYISLSTVTLATGDWQQISVPVWMAYTLDVYFRVSNLTWQGSAKVDDLKVACGWW
jgi:hypothetical protein